ncbi:unnamed protein product [Auanema sp. JU1783]|nr:unnamed protein product [Auanema sp. JU1783]
MRYLKATMQKRRVTVHFGTVRVVVPCPEDTLTVRDLANASILRYKKATGKTDSDVRIIHMECLRDAGILDMDDRLVDVFDETTDQILAIYDEQSPNGSGEPGNTYQVLSSPYGNYSSPTGSSHSNNFPPSRMTSSSSVTTCNISYPLTHSSSMDMGPIRRALPNGRSHYVHIAQDPNDMSEVASNYQRVSPPCEVRPGVSSSSSGSDVISPPIRSSLRSETATPNRNRVTMSPEVEKRIAESSDRDGRLTRSSARKSRISDTFFEAKERMDEMQQSTSSIKSFTNPSRPPPVRSPEDPDKTIIIFPDDDETSMGIEVTGVEDDATGNTDRIVAVQIIRIHADGRVGRDGRLVVGDNIVSIDGRPVYQMSVLRARGYLSDLKKKHSPSLTIARPKEQFQCEKDEQERKRQELGQKKPIFSALQQANTSQALGQSTIINLKKSNNGFGFTVTGRETTKGERLFYIGTVKPNGVALGYLKTGDRLLQINGEQTCELTQNEVVDRLKRASVGQSVEFVVSRVTDENKENQQSTPSANSSTIQKYSPEPVSPSPSKKSNSDVDELKFEIPLNSTGSAGLGVSLKARVTVKSDKTRHDCGIFIKNVLHNGAAFKDSRLRVDDRIIGIEELNLIGMSNTSAGEAVTKRLKSIDPTAKSVTLIVQRKIPLGSDDIMISSSHRESCSSDGDKRSSTASEQPRLDESEVQSVDPFDREAPTRKSMSEKRGMGASLDPNNLKLFQEIKHQRQSSAPPPTLTSSSSFHGHAQQRSASQRAAARARSQSVHPRDANASKSASRPHVSIKEPAKRRSLSVESIRAGPHGDVKNGQLSQGRPGEFNDFYATSPHPYPPGSPGIVMDRQYAVNKDRHRRKSVGSTMKSWFGFGSKSRESSPEKTLDAERRQKAREAFTRGRDNVAETEGLMNRSYGTPNMSRRDPQMYSMYANEPYQLPSPDKPLIVSNSRFFTNWARTPQTIMTTNSSTDSKPTVTQTVPLSYDPPPIPPRPHRPITTLFPVRSRTTEPPLSPAQFIPASVVKEHQLTDEHQHRTTTTCSTHGSRTVEVVESGQPPQLRPRMAIPIDRQSTGRKAPLPDPGQDRLLPTPIYTHHPQSHHNSIRAFPTTRYAYTPTDAYSYSQPPERLSLRARKKLRRSARTDTFDSTFPEEPIYSQDKLVREIPQSPVIQKRHVVKQARDYRNSMFLSTDNQKFVNTFNAWNSQTGASLPSRGPRAMRGRVDNMFESVTDC